jgi:hypothetical protein
VLRINAIEGVSMSTQANTDSNVPADSLAARVAQLEQRWSQLKWAAGIVGLAVLIITGYGMIDIPRRAVAMALEQVTPIAEETAKEEAQRVIPDSLIEEAKKANAQAKGAAKEAVELVGRLKTQLTLPAALYSSTVRGQAISSDEAGATIIDFSTKVYNTHSESVTTGGNWKYTAPEPGIYSVTALAVYSQKGAGGTALGIYRNGGISVYLAQVYPSSVSGTTIGGTGTIELKRGDAFDIRINTFGDAREAALDSVGATWVSIHYLRPLANFRE